MGWLNQYKLSWSLIPMIALPTLMNCKQRRYGEANVKIAGQGTNEFPDKPVTAKSDPVLKSTVALMTAEYQGKPEGLLGCSGWIRSPRVIQTAAHCFKKFTTDDALQDFAKNGLFVVAGPSAPRSNNLVARKPIKIVRHPRYPLDPNVQGAFEFDTALILLASDQAMPAPFMPVPVAKKEPKIGDEVIMTGYSNRHLDPNDPALTDGVLRWAMTKVDGIQSERLVVFGGQNARPFFCTGDSGGPLYQRNEDGSLAVVGLNSSTKAQWCEDGLVSEMAFARIIKLETWASNAEKALLAGKSDADAGGGGEAGVDKTEISVPSNKSAAIIAGIKTVITNEKWSSQTVMSLDFACWGKNSPAIATCRYFLNGKEDTFDREGSDRDRYISMNNALTEILDAKGISNGVLLNIKCDSGKCLIKMKE
jgi:hypothetical protein